MVQCIIYAVLLLSTVAQNIYAQTACNGNAALCDRQYSNVTQIGTHDSALVGALPQDNQDESVTAQLNAGIRFLQAQSHVDPFGSLSLCHTSCFLLDAGSVESYLITVKAWLDANPNEVLTLLLTNGDNVNVSMFDAAFTSSGIKSYAFVPASSPNTLLFDAWPTLQELITGGTRLVLFLGTYLPFFQPPAPLPTKTNNPTAPTTNQLSFFLFLTQLLLLNRLRRLPGHVPLHPGRILLLF